MKNKISLFIIVFIISMIIAIYNFDVLSTFVTEWHSGKHYFGKFIFVILVLVILFSLAVTFSIELIRKIVFQRKR
jgi:uncharacterized membrane protein YedE/YeeE